MTDHTPGPWVAIQFDHRWHGPKPIFRDGLWHILPESDVERLPIATVDRADDNHAPTRVAAECDARLIAAAPDLLAALKETLELISYDAHYDPADRFIAMCRAAISRAEGRS